MASISDIRYHIKSINQTRQITNAMYLVSAARMRKAIKRIEQNSAYYYKALDTMLDIRAHTGEINHPYLTHRPGKPKMGYIIIAGDKGLAGSYNHDILAFAEQSMKGRNVTQILTVGDVATSYFKRTGREVNARFENMMTDLSVDTSRALMALIKRLYDQRVIDELHIIYMRFINSVRQKPKDFKLLPIELSDFGADHPPREDNIEMLYDPSPERVFDALVPQFMIGVLYGTMVHAYVSENSARMSAMENATHSADKLIKKLTLQYNSMRQLAITSELNEIVSAANAFHEKGDHNG
ncbi:MAG TPA: ATP synthase F1 subunit gamma [Terriglobales bacterium]|nr:ATP synthase F1 subunit gamma [Terriglobales bacterium]